MSARTLRVCDTARDLRATVPTGMHSFVGQCSQFETDRSASQRAASAVEWRVHAVGLMPFALIEFSSASLFLITIKWHAQPLRFLYDAEFRFVFTTGRQNMTKSLQILLGDLNFFLTRNSSSILTVCENRRRLNFSGPSCVVRPAHAHKYTNYR